MVCTAFVGLHIEMYDFYGSLVVKVAIFSERHRVPRPGYKSNI